MTPHFPTASRHCGLATSRGFTLVEMLVVLVVVGILASIALPLSELALRRQQENELRDGLQTIRTALDAYKRAVDEGHVTRDALASGFPPNLDTLVSGVEDARSPTREPIYFLRQLPRDPFADPDLPAAQTWVPRSYASPPDDPKPGADVFDVHSGSDEIGLNGIPYRLW